MKSPATLTVFALSLVSSDAFSSGFTGSQLSNVPQHACSSTLTMEYIPSGMSKEQWRKLKEQEKNKNKGKNLGKVGITSFQSRSFADWQKAGGKNLFPVDPKTVKDPKDLPYMQRPGGMPDDSDLKGPKKAGGFNFFGGNKKKEAPKPVVEEKPKKKGWFG